MPYPITATNDEIERLVYELYELTDEEIAIVEESVKKRHCRRAEVITA